MKENLPELKPLKISCTSSDCDSNLHCFKYHKKKMTADQKGACRECGIKLVNWNRVHRRDISDVEYTFQSLKYELIRHHNWHIEIDLRAINHARRKGKVKIKIAVEKRIRKYIADVNSPFDGRQTPHEGNIIFYAQHATASCCRKCIEYWHNIPQNRNLTEDEIQYMTDLVIIYINERLPYLTENGEYIPRIKRDDSVSKLTQVIN